MKKIDKALVVKVIGAVLTIGGWIADSWADNRKKKDLETSSK